eukprot:scaffold22.g6049.t1
MMHGTPAAPSLLLTTAPASAMRRPNLWEPQPLSGAPSPSGPQQAAPPARHDLSELLSLRLGASGKPTTLHLLQAAAPPTSSSADEENAPPRPSSFRPPPMPGAGGPAAAAAAARLGWAAARAAAPAAGEVAPAPPPSSPRMLPPSPSGPQQPPPPAAAVEKWKIPSGLPVAGLPPGPPPGERTVLCEVEFYRQLAQHLGTPYLKLYDTALNKYVEALRVFEEQAAAGTPLSHYKKDCNMGAQSQLCVAYHASIALDVPVMKSQLCVVYHASSGSCAWHATPPFGEGRPLGMINELYRIGRVAAARPPCVLNVVVGDLTCSVLSSGKVRCGAKLITDDSGALRPGLFSRYYGGLELLGIKDPPRLFIAPAQHPQEALKPVGLRSTRALVGGGGAGTPGGAQRRAQQICADAACLPLLRLEARSPRALAHAAGCKQQQPAQAPRVAIGGSTVQGRAAGKGCSRAGSAQQQAAKAPSTGVKRGGSGVSAATGNTKRQETSA